MKKTLLYIIILVISFSLHAQVAPKEETPSVQNVDLEKLNKESTKDPKFSSDSKDQDDIDKNLDKNNDQLNTDTVFHIYKLTECRELKTVKEIEECRRSVLQNKK